MRLRKAIWTAYLAIVCTACFGTANESSGEAEAVGEVRMSLRTTNGAITYRLRDATFTIDAPGTPVLSTEVNPNLASLTQTLPVGGYTITLSAGWRLEALDHETALWSDVEATLSGSPVKSFAIQHGETTSVQYGFLLSTGTVVLGEGDLEVGVTVSSTCDPVDQNCPAAEKCTSVLINENTGERTTACTADGTLALGAACTESTLGTPDACAAGSICLQGTCQALCEVGVADPECGCVAYAGLFSDGSNVGVCIGACDPLAQDCPSGEGCYLTGTAFVCAPAALQTPEGGACEYVNGCDVGLACSGVSQSNPNGGVCTPYCQYDGSSLCANGLPCLQTLAGSNVGVCAQP